MAKKLLIPSALMHKPVVRRVGIVAYPGVEAIDIAGPFEVFGLANLSFQFEKQTADLIYQIDVIAEQRGAVKTFTGLEIVANRSFDEIDEHLHTLIIPGTGLIDALLEDVALINWVKKIAPKVNRLVSVCTGAFILAECGFLDDRRATTHWNWSAQFKQKYPRVKLESDKIFIRENSIYTSGGISSSIDLTLALIEEDWGQELALYIARFLVVYVKRPGGQAQFSAYLTSEPCGRQSFKELQTWIIENPNADLQVETLARRMAMSPRNFARTFLQETGITPAKFVERVRIDAARQFLELKELSIDTVAVRAGFNDAERMRRAFVRNLGVNPREYRARFSFAYG